MKPKYKVFDLMEYRDFLGCAFTMSDVIKIGMKQYRDTDGECAIYYQELNEDSDQWDGEMKAVYMGEEIEAFEDERWGN